MTLQKIEDRLPFVAALVILLGVSFAAEDALANDAAIEILPESTISNVVAGS